MTPEVTQTVRALIEERLRYVETMELSWARHVDQAQQELTDALYRQENGDRLLAHLRAALAALPEAAAERE